VSWRFKMLMSWLVRRKEERASGNSELKNSQHELRTIAPFLWPNFRQWRNECFQSKNNKKQKVRCETLVEEFKRDKEWGLSAVTSRNICKKSGGREQSTYGKDAKVLDFRVFEDTVGNVKNSKDEIE